ncbi:MAG: hypothetical protein JXR83_10215 [Deltaproteobacteria bacterium]|nr:hypothetical protein [Deltaproteobacteria bacterium]
MADPTFASRHPAPSRELRIDTARAEDDPELRRILRDNPMRGEIALAMEREPDFFAGTAIEGDRHDVIVAREPAGTLAGFCCRSVRTVYVNGQPRRLGYLGQLRLDRPYRGRVRIVADGFARVRALPRAGELPYDLTSIVSDNAAAWRLLTSGLPGIPTYHRLENLTTLALVTQPKRRGRRRERFSIDRLGADEVPELSDWLDRQQRRFQFAVQWDLRQLGQAPWSRGLSSDDFLVAHERGAIIGCIALWDQRSFRQNRITGYGRLLARARPLVNLTAALGGWPRLPEPGQLLAQCHLSHLAVDDDRFDVAYALVDAALVEAFRRDLKLVTLGVSSRRPLGDAIRRGFRPRLYRSTLYAVHWPDGAAAVRELDNRVPHVETAVL